MSFDQLAEEYANILKNYRYSLESQNEIVRKINGLVYSQNNKPLSHEDKTKLAKLIIEKINPRNHVYREADNKEYLAAVSYIISKLK